MRKRLQAVFILACLVAPMLAAEAQTPTVRLATLAPRGTSYHQALLALREKWRQAPGGGVALTIYPDGTMGSESDMVSRMRVGQLQAAMLTVIGLQEIDDSVSALQEIPMMFRSFDEVDYVREKLRPRLEKRFLEKGFVVLFWGDAGWIRYFSRDAVVHPADLKKARMFVWAGDNRLVDLMKALGYQPVPLETGDMLSGLQTGMINALATVPFFALAGQFYRHVPHMLELNWAPMVGGLVITRKTWEAIPPATQAALLKAAAEAGEQIKARGRAESERAVEAMKQRGLTVHAVPLAVEGEWRSFAEQVLYPKLIRGGSVPADLFDEARRLVNEFRAASGEKK